MFKKILSLFLVLSFVFACSTCSSTLTLEFAEKAIAMGETTNIVLNSSDDFTAELDEEGIDVENSDEYDISSYR